MSSEDSSDVKFEIGHGIKKVTLSYLAIIKRSAIVDDETKKGPHPHARRPHIGRDVTLDLSLINRCLAPFARGFVGRRCNLTSPLVPHFAP